jgi:hypothetical protein
MEMENGTTLTVRINGTIETPPSNNREQFRQSVIDTILFVLKTQDVDIEYIGYKPDRMGIHHLDSVVTQYEDCIYASLSVNENLISQFEDTHRKEQIIEAFVEAFENKTHRHLEIDSTMEKKGKKHRIIEMSSDWKHYLKDTDKIG